MLLLSLPECVFIHSIQPFLSDKDYRNTLNTTKSAYFQEIKKKSCCYFLLPPLSLKLIANEVFQRQIFSLIEAPSRQLGLYINRDFMDVSAVNYVHFLVLDDFGEKFIHPDLSAFSSISRLKLMNCSILKTLKGLSSVVDLQLMNLKGLTDISALASCRSLSNVKISNCYALLNINSLSHVKVLHIESCPIVDQGMKSFSEGSVKNLSMKKVYSVRSLNHIHSLEKLFLETVGVYSVSDLPLLKELVVRSCRYLETYSNLPSLKKVCFRSSFDWETIPSSYLKHISIFSPGKVRSPLNFHSLSYLYSLQLRLNGDRVDVNGLAILPQLRKLELQDVCVPKLNIHLFQQIHWLSLHRVDCGEGITEAMPNLRVARFNDCEYLTTIQGLEGNNRKDMKLMIQECPKLLFNESFYQMILNNIDCFICEQYQPESDLIDWHMQQGQLLSPPDDQHRREKVVEIRNNLPFLKSILFQPWFSQLRILILKRFDGTNLKGLTTAGIHLIPVLHIHQAKYLTSLYPKGIIPRHEWILLDDCQRLADFSSVAAVPRVSITACPIGDLRPLKECHVLELGHWTSGKPPTGFGELKDRLDWFPNLDDFAGLTSTFRIDREPFYFDD